MFFFLYVARYAIISTSKKKLGDNLKRIIYAVINIILSVVIGVCLSFMLKTWISDKTANEQSLLMKNSEQYSTQAISTLIGSSDTVKSSLIKYPAVGDNYAVIHNDARDFSKDLYFGDTVAILDISIGQYAKSGIPGEGRPLLVAGHNGTHFNKLQYFEKGDHVQIDTSYGKYVYEVDDMEILYNATETFDASILDKDEEMLIMYSCYPFNVVGTPDRYFVYAHKISGPNIEEDGRWLE